MSLFQNCYCKIWPILIALFFFSQDSSLNPCWRLFLWFAVIKWSCPELSFRPPYICTLLDIAGQTLNWPLATGFCVEHFSYLVLGKGTVECFPELLVLPFLLSLFLKPNFLRGPSTRSSPNVAPCCVAIVSCFSAEGVNWRPLGEVLYAPHFFPLYVGKASPHCCSCLQRAPSKNFASLVFIFWGFCSEMVHTHCGSKQLA